MYFNLHKCMHTCRELVFIAHANLSLIDKRKGTKRFAKRIITPRSVHRVHEILSYSSPPSHQFQRFIVCSTKSK